jgi:hypothetical protein
MNFSYMPMYEYVYDSFEPFEALKGGVVSDFFGSRG